MIPTPIRAVLLTIITMLLTELGMVTEKENATLEQLNVIPVREIMPKGAILADLKREWTMLILPGAMLFAFSVLKFRKTA